MDGDECPRNVHTMHVLERTRESMKKHQREKKGGEKEKHVSRTSHPINKNCFSFFFNLFGNQRTENMSLWWEYIVVCIRCHESIRFHSNKYVIYTFCVCVCGGRDGCDGCDGEHFAIFRRIHFAEMWHKLPFKMWKTEIICQFVIITKGNRTLLYLMRLMRLICLSVPI